MYKLRANGEDVSYGIKEYVLDTPADLEDLPKSSMGSTAIVISTAEVYMVDGQGQWRLLA